MNAAAAQGRLEGTLGFARVPQLLAQAQAAVGADGVLDLGGVSQVDSAGLALLLDLSRRCKARGQVLHIRDAQPQPLQLAHFFGLDRILHFD